MTKKQYEAARRKAVFDYMEKARLDCEMRCTTQRQKANAQRRLRRCSELLALWECHGFWTPDNLRVYEMVYRHYREDAVVSAV